MSMTRRCNSTGRTSRAPRHASLAAGLLLALASTAPAQTSIWRNAGSDWGTAGNWSAGVPTDVARFTNSTVKVSPNLNGGAFEVNTLLIDSNAGSAYTNFATGGGSILLKGSTGLQIDNTPAETPFYGTFLVGRDAPTTRQIWRNATDKRTMLYGPLGGTGTIHVTTSNGEFRYFTATQPSLVGGLTVDTQGRDDGRGSMFGWFLQTNDTCSVALGRTASGAAGLIDLSTQTMGKSLYLPGQNLAGFRLVAISTANTAFNVTLENDFRVADQGATISTCQYRLNAATAQPNLIFGGKLYLAGALRYSDDQDINPIPNITHGGLIHRLFLGGVELDQSAPRRNLFRYRRSGGRDVLLEGKISDGAGSYENPLILQASGQELYLSGTNTYTHGTVVEPTGQVAGTLQRYVRVQIGSTLGTGPVTVAPGGMLRLEGTGAIASGQKVDVQSTVLAAGVLGIAYDDASLATLVAPTSSGILGLSGTSGPNFNALMAAGPGNGRMVLGAGRAAGTFTGASLKADPDGVYRLGGGSHSYSTEQLTLDVPSSTVGVLVGANAVQIGSRAINGFGAVMFSDVNTYTGPTTITSPIGVPLQTRLTLLTSAAGSPLGSASGTLALEGADVWLNSGAGAVPPVAKGATTFTSQNWLRGNSGTIPVTFQMDSLSRLNGGMLYLRGYGNKLQVNERITVVTPPALVNGMTAPYLHAAGLNDTTRFATYDATTDATGVKGFGMTTMVALPAAPGAGTEIAEVTASTAVADTRSVWAFRTTAALTGAGTLNILSGGLILEGASGFTVAPNLAFGTSEAVVYCARSTATLSGVVTAANGLTKGGNSTLTLSNLGNSIAGTLTVNQGTLDGSWDLNDTTPGSLGAVSNPIYLNGGALSCGGASTYVTLSANRTVTLGPLGGKLTRGGANNNVIAPVRAKFTGPGALIIDVSGSATRAQIESAANDYTGGTVFSGLEDCYIAPNAKLGTGPVTVCAGDGYREIFFYGSENLKGPGDVYLPLQAASGAMVNFATNSAVMGSLSGAGDIYLGSALQGSVNNWPCELTVGLDNGSSTFHGLIGEAAQKQWWGDFRAMGSLVKDGSGTFALYGSHEYRGATKAKGGVLRLMGRVAGNLEVLAGGTVTGSGVVGGTLNVAGTLGAELSNGVAKPLTVSGVATLGGALTVSETGTSMAVGTSTVLLNAASISGSFASLPAGFSVQAQGGTLTLSRVGNATLILVR